MHEKRRERGRTYRVGLILGFLMLMSPVFTLTTIRCLAGIYLILLGIDAVVVAFSRMGRRL